MRKAPPFRPRFVVGIDLGTTNSAVAYADTASESSVINVFEIPQLTDAATVESRPLLPSFLYLAAPQEISAAGEALPWKTAADHIVGTFARRRGTEVPTRIVASAKSWLSFGEADRTAAILPWGSPDDVPKLSPVDAAAQYLMHMRAAWDHAFPAAPLADQDVLLTVPASFDPVARELTVRAAHAAGLPHVTVLEEPQAALYAWIDANGDAWREAMRVGDMVLVCDVGGGTTDFSLIAARDSGGQLDLERIAVGDHILLGGDNMDLALAYGTQEQLKANGTQLDQWQLRSLTLLCRDGKERLLADTHETKFPMAILGRGRKVVGGSLRVVLERADVERILVDGFFPRCAVTDVAQAQRRTGLQEIGLPYASDPAITRHLAQFLRRHTAASATQAAGFAAPTAVLFNGGVMAAATLRTRLIDVINEWLTASALPPVRVLAGGNPEFAVARGAAYYGLARRGRGIRIRGGTSRAYYIGIETAMPAVPGMRPPIKALCVVPHGLEEGTEVGLPAQEFGLIVGQPAEFRFLGSATRRDDRVGAYIDSWDDDIEELAPLSTTLDASGQEGTVVPVCLNARVNEVGVLELWCQSRDGRKWKLEFNVRQEQK